MSALKTLTKPW